MIAIPRTFVGAVLALLAVAPIQLVAQDSSRNQANYKLAEKFSNDFINQFVQSTSVSPNWIGESDRFWYEFQTSDGNHYWMVDPDAGTKEPLFDHERMAGLLSEAVRKPIDTTHLDLSSAEVNDPGTKMRFVVEDTRFEYHFVTGDLVNKGVVPDRQGGRGARGGGQRGRGNRGRGNRGRGNRGRGRGGRGGQEEEEDEGPSRAHRNFSPDRTAYVFAQGHNLYYVEASDQVKARNATLDEEKKKEEEAAEEAEEEDVDGWNSDWDEAEDEGEDDETDDEEDVDERELWADDADEDGAAQLTDDGETDYSFGARGGRGGNRGNNREEEGDEEEEDPKVRPSVNWAPDSSAFYVTRRDSREVAELYLVNSLSEPRPTLETYNYPMPGEENVRRSELFIFDRGSGELAQFEAKWKDESYRNLRWHEEGEQLRLVRQDRLLRNIEFLSVDPDTGASEVLFSEGFDDANITLQGPRYLEDRDEFLWWSERSGWGHYYLYDLDGKLKNTVNIGTYRASSILEVDEDRGILYFRGNGREPGENVYYNHLYRIFLDGTGLTLMDPGDADHSSALAPSQRFVVDNSSRMDAAPKSVLRSADGTTILELEETDLSSLQETGWKIPETFVVKAADGVTDLFGNMWKPFDFDPTKQYPIIAHVYPGPQSEGVNHTFSATGGGRQQLAQLGFIVIQVGHRGGTPGRSKQYHSFGYGDMRDYGLADKKAAIEKLAAIHPFIDVERVGIYGHSGGGFMTGAAMLREPYNEFFKVGVSTSGNHDNNVYGDYWAERYQGLQEVEVEVEEDEDTEVGVSDNGNGNGNGQDTEQDKETEKETRFEIDVPANHELAENLKGKLLLMHGDMDNNVHPAGTIRLVDALIKANKRFDLMIFPGARHSYGAARAYSTQKTWEYFAEHLLDDYESSADINEKSATKRRR